MTAYIVRYNPWWRPPLISNEPENALDDDDEPEEPQQKSCCSCWKKFRKENLKSEESNVKESPKVYHCCCCWIIFGGQSTKQQEKRRGRKKKRKCCEWKWWQHLCIIIWLVIIVAFIFGLLFCLGTYEFTRVALDRRDLRTWIYITVFIWFVFLSSVIFLILTKMQCGSCCCIIFKGIWFLAFHIPFGVVVCYFIYTTANPTPIEVLRAFQLDNGWLKHLQEETFCCFAYDDINGIRHFGINANYSAECEHKFDNVSMQYAEHTLRCDKLLALIYDDCMKSAAIYVIILLVIGVIPFVIYTTVYIKSRRKANRVSPPEDQDQDQSRNGQRKEPSDKTNKIHKDNKAWNYPTNKLNDETTNSDIRASKKDQPEINNVNENKRQTDKKSVPP